MKIAICDDERADLEQIVAYSKQYDSSNPVRGFSSGDSLLAAFQTDFYDLVFLDIEMAGTNGLTVGSRLMECGVKPIIIFTTQSLNYAVRGYGIALRYLIKPIDYETFAGIMRVVLDKVLPQKY